MKKILVVGASGQIGTELTLALRNKWGIDQVIASDIKTEKPAVLGPGIYQTLDILERDAVRKYIIEEKIEVVYLLAALLSATAEKQPDFAWKLNMESLFTILDLAKEGYLKQVFWPSSIAVFGSTTPRTDTPQYTVMEPTTVYGISKLAGERWCEYYNQHFNTDIRSLRYPGLISYKSPPGGGTTDYAIEIFHEAKRRGTYNCFLSKDTALPMMFMDDAIRATMELMEAPKEHLRIKSSYNLGGITFTPQEMANNLQRHIPGFTIHYAPDFRQSIADSWPKSIDDSYAREDWNWKNTFDLAEIIKIMLQHV
ncbi:MAG: NAD-dependent epimerase/dehydratase family protein [Bacteroidetes bacterium]|nr:NAD-dependent epimerase/dehydratase family protein [Bacteroidota bacterium]MBM3424015.1 NAD-dependent epimerase/dehydratase family protein [Bacteroidota bacterium]